MAVVIVAVAAAVVVVVVVVVVVLVLVVVVVVVVVVVLVLVVSAAPNVFCVATRHVPRSTPGSSTGPQKSAFRYVLQSLLASAATANQI